MWQIKGFSHSLLPSFDLHLHLLLCFSYRIKHPIGPSHAASGRDFSLWAINVHHHASCSHRIRTVGRFTLRGEEGGLRFPCQDSQTQIHYHSQGVAGHMRGGGAGCSVGLQDVGSIRCVLVPSLSWKWGAGKCQGHRINKPPPCSLSKSTASCRRK